jgi:hypothetical protein
MLLCGAFFRLPSLSAWGFVALKARVLGQNRVAGIPQRLVVGNLLGRCLARIRLTQVPHALGLGIDHHHILVTMGLVLATVVQGLFCWALRALATALGPVNNQLRGLFLGAFMVSKLAGLPCRQQLQGRQPLPEEGQQVVHPVVHPRLAQRKHLPQQALQGIGFLIDQNEEQFLLRRWQLPFASPADVALAHLAALGCVPSTPALVYFTERGSQPLKLFGSQSGQRQKLAPLLREPFVFKQSPRLAYFG